MVSSVDPCLPRPNITYGPHVLDLSCKPCSSYQEPSYMHGPCSLGPSTWLGPHPMLLFLFSQIHSLVVLRNLSVYIHTTELSLLCRTTTL